MNSNIIYQNSNNIEKKLFSYNDIYPQKVLTFLSLGYYQ